MRRSGGAAVHCDNHNYAVPYRRATISDRKSALELL